MYTKLCGYKHTKLPEKNTTVKVIQVVLIFSLKTISFLKVFTEAKLLVLLHSYQEDMLFVKWNVR